MWDKPSINRLPGERLHLRHGPIAVVLKVWAQPDVVRQAHRLVTRHFPKILIELGDQFEELGKPYKKAVKFDSKVAERMVDAILPYSAAPITPMAAFTGAVADEVLRIVQAAGPIERAAVNDGGDIAIYLAEGQTLKFGPNGECSENPPPPFKNPITLTSEMGLGGLAAAGVHHRGLSQGVADSVFVFARSAAMANAAATAVADAVTVDSKAVTRKPASKVEADSGLGDVLVTTKVGRLSSEEIDVALAAGVAVAERSMKDNLMAGAVLILQGEARTVGSIANGVQVKL